MAQHMAQQNAEGSRDLSTLIDASAELQHLVQTIWRLRQPDGAHGTVSRRTAALART